MFHLRLKTLMFGLPMLAMAATGAAHAGSITDESEFGSDGENHYVVDDAQKTILRGSIGIASIDAREHVYAGPTGDDNLSLLLWHSLAPIASFDAKSTFFDGWTLRGHVDVAINGASSVGDYDWTSYSPSYAFDDWDHRSLSPSTLDWYFNGDFALGRDLPINDAVTVNLNGGFKYTDVRWTARGGDFIYSENGFRDTTFSIPDNVVLGTYRQQVPTVFAGIDTSIDDGPWSFEASGKAGLVLYGQSVDQHLQRNPPMSITDQLNLGRVLSADAKLGFAMSDHMSAFLEGSYEQMWSAHDVTDYRQISDNTLLIHDDSIGGAELRTMSIKAGFRGDF